MNDKPTPNHYFIRYWNDGDKYRSQSQDFFDYDETMKEYSKLGSYDNIQIFEIFLHVFSAIGVEACENIDTRDFVYED